MGLPSTTSNSTLVHSETDLRLCHGGCNDVDHQHQKNGGGVSEMVVDDVEKDVLRVLQVGR